MTVPVSRAQSADALISRLTAALQNLIEDSSDPGSEAYGAVWEGQQWHLSAATDDIPVRAQSGDTPEPSLRAQVAAVRALAERAAATPPPARRWIGWSVEHGDSCFGTFTRYESAETALASVQRGCPDAVIVESYRQADADTSIPAADILAALASPGEDTAATTDEAVEIIDRVLHEHFDYDVEPDERDALARNIAAALASRSAQPSEPRAWHQLTEQEGGPPNERYEGPRFGGEPT